MALDKAITFIASCDFCSETFDTDAEDFQGAITVMKREGWKVFKDTVGDWQHKCGSCQEDAFEDLT